MRFLRILLPLGVVVAGGASWVPTPYQERLLAKSSIDPARVSRLFVISDIHGDLETLVQAIHMALLSANEIANPQVSLPTLDDLRGIFNEAMRGKNYFLHHRREFPYFKESGFYLIQMGDLIDRGMYSRACMQVMEMLAIVTGFEVVQLVGNHELQAAVNSNYAIDSHYVHREDDLKRDYLTEAWIREYISRNMLAMTRIGGSGNPAVPGSPSASAATLFVHAGIDIALIKGILKVDKEGTSVDSPWRYPRTYNEELLKHLSNPNISDGIKAIQVAFLANDSPLWTRSISEWTTDCAAVDYILEWFNVARIVVGHTAQGDTRKMALNCDGKVILTDTALSRFNFHDLSSAPAIMVMDFDAGRLTGINANYDSSSTTEPIINNDGTPSIPSLTDTQKVAKVFIAPTAKNLPSLERIVSGPNTLDEDIILHDGDVTIGKYVHEGATGLIVRFKSDDVDSQMSTRELIEALDIKPHPNIPRIIPLGDHNKPGSIELFLISDAEAMITPDQYTFRNIRAMKDILLYMQNINICFASNPDPPQHFALNSAGQVHLVNVSHLIHCTLHQQKINQFNAIQAHMPHPPL